MFEAKNAARHSSSLLKAIKLVLAEPGGASFYASYLEQVCNPRGEAKWKTLECMRTALRATLQYHKNVAEVVDDALATDSAIDRYRDDSPATDGRMQTSPDSQRAGPPAAAPATPSALPVTAAASSTPSLALYRARSDKRLRTAMRGDSSGPKPNPASATVFIVEKADPERTSRVTEGRTSELSDLSTSFTDLYRCIELLLQLSTTSALHETLLMLWVGSTRGLAPFSAVAGAALVEYALTKFSSGLPSVPEQIVAALEEVIRAWAGQLLGLLSAALKLPITRAPANYTQLGNIVAQPLFEIMHQDLISELETNILIERVVAMAGRASFVPGSPALVGLLQAWSRASSPSLATRVGKGYLRSLLKYNAEDYEPTKIDHHRPPVRMLGVRIRDMSTAKKAITMERKAEQLEAIVAGLARLAWSLPVSMNALEMFGKLVKHRGEDHGMNFSLVYLRKGSQLREQASKRSRWQQHSESFGVWLTY